METPDPIFELLNTEIPTKLWHYTSIQGFHGIVTSKRIFATDLRFLSDRQEFIHARKIADDVVKETPERGSNQLPVKEFLGRAVNLAFSTGPLHPGRLQVFVASFSTADDLLSQWRGYSQATAGVSLAFDLTAFRPPVGADTLVSFAPCIYDPSRQRELIRRALHHFTEQFEEYWDGALKIAGEIKGSWPTKEVLVKEIMEKNPKAPNFGQRLQEALIKTSTDLLRITALLKNQAFHEEREWRLVLPVSTDKPLKNPRRFRVGNTTLIPYIAHPFSFDHDSPLPLADIILGPGSDANAVLAAQSFLASEGIKLVPRESAVPFRSL